MSATLPQQLAHAEPAASWSLTGLALPADLSFEAWLRIGRELKTVEQSLMWWIGDWLRYGEARYGETYIAAAEATGYSYQTLARAKSVAQTYEPCMRIQNLSFAHHQQAASLPALERGEVLQAAAEAGWTVRELLGELRRRKADSLPLAPVDPESPFGYALRCLARLVGAVFDIDPASFVGEGKGGPDQVQARQVLIYLLHTEVGFDQSTIARGLGRHHSTVSHTLAVVEPMLDEPEVERAFARLGEIYRDLKEARDKVPELLEAMT